MAGQTGGLGPHDHSSQGQGGGSISPDSAVIAQELGLPDVDDVSNGPQTQGRLVYATGNGTSTEGIYRYDGTSYAQVGSSSEWQEDGNGNIVPVNGETVGDGTTIADHQSVTTGTLGINGFEQVEKDGEIDLSVNANKATYTINNPGADAYLIHVVDWDGDGEAKLGVRPNDYGSSSGEDNYVWYNLSGNALTNATSWGIGGHNSTDDRPGFSRHLIRRGGGQNRVGIGHLGAWSQSFGNAVLAGRIDETDPLGGQITSFVFRERDGNDLTRGTARIARVTLG